ncbi:rod shape-determining protein MreC [Actinorugispora endophytica]|uniref:Cell shape-determining protein MreC n=1 Tax=Actinorugispora endophytica TaxID=1605990 RepID=A0A4R6UNV7_9ACTN|nr:rod shape-determining protein MreC [Actinorugispora endophytica]TDQ46875.1 rod shape-determining protein MreC [Actinorugispora endophytica]
MPRDTPRSRAALVLLLAVGLVLLVLDVRVEGDPVSGGARAAGAAAFVPLASAVGVAAAPVTGVTAALAAAPASAARIDELERRNAELAAEVDALERDGARSAELADLLTLSGLGGYEIVAAQAVTRLTGHGYADAVTLDVGARDGVAPDMTVISRDGLVGRVTEVTEQTSTVTLVTDGASAVGVRLAGSKEIGVVDGTGNAVTDRSPLVLELLDGSAVVREGDRVVTLGSHGGAPFVPGVPVGTVTEVADTPGALSRTARVTPFADISRIDVVGVVVAEPEDDPRDSLLRSAPKGGDR